MFEKNTIWAYPTDTSFGLGVRSDDESGMEQMHALKQREVGKFFSLMVRDEAMLYEFAEVGDDRDWLGWFMEKPRTAIFAPTKKLSQSKYWPKEKVAFRICTIADIAQYIEVPVTATSANFSGEPSIYSVSEIQKKFGHQVKCYDEILELPIIPASEIWDFTERVPNQLR